MSVTTKYEVVFPEWYDEIGEMEADAKGWLQGVEVRFSDGDRQPLFFYDPVRLSQDLEAEAESGAPFIACPGLIVIPRISRATILKVIEKLIDDHYFPIHQSTTSTSLNDVLRTADIAATVR